MARSVGNHIATRLVQIGISDWFGVPGRPSTMCSERLLISCSCFYACTTINWTREKPIRAAILPDPHGKNCSKGRKVEQQ